MSAVDKISSDRTVQDTCAYCTLTYGFQLTVSNVHLRVHVTLCSCRIVCRQFGRRVPRWETIAVSGNLYTTENWCGLFIEPTIMARQAVMLCVNMILVTEGRRRSVVCRESGRA